MSATLDECEKMAKQLSLHERARLIEDLVKTLDEIDEEECQQLWIAEADRRYNEYKEGNITAKTAEETFETARQTLARLK